MGLVGGGPVVGELGGGEPVVGGVWSVDVVVDAVVLGEDLGFEERVELPAVEELVAYAAVERLDPGVLPRRPGVDEHRVEPGVGAPAGDGVGHEFRSVECPT